MLELGFCQQAALAILSLLSGNEKYKLIGQSFMMDLLPGMARCPGLFWATKDNSSKVFYTKKIRRLFHFPITFAIPQSLSSSSAL